MAVTTVISPAITPTLTISLFLMEQVMPIKVSYLAVVTNVRKELFSWNTCHYKTVIM